MSWNFDSIRVGSKVHRLFHYFRCSECFKAESWPTGFEICKCLLGKTPWNHPWLGIALPPPPPPAKISPTILQIKHWVFILIKGLDFLVIDGKYFLLEKYFHMFKKEFEDLKDIKIYPKGIIFNCLNIGAECSNLPLSVIIVTICFCCKYIYSLNKC